MTLQDLLASDELLWLSDEIVPSCEDAPGASALGVQKRLFDIYRNYRSADIESLSSLVQGVALGRGKDHPYFATFAETVMEAYWTSDVGLSLTGFKTSQKRSS